MRNQKQTKKTVALMASTALVLGGVSPVWAEEEAPKLEKASVEFYCTEDGQALLSALSGVDFSILDSVKMIVDATETDEAVGARTAVEVNGTQITDIMVYLDKLNLTEYIQMPELSEAYMKVALEDLLAQWNITSDMLESADDDSAIESAMMENAMQYVTPFLELFQTTSLTKTVSVGDESVEISYTGVTVNVADFLGTLTQQMEAMKDDASMQAVLESADVSIEDAISSINSAVEENDLSNCRVNLLMGSDEAGSILNAYAEIEMNGVTLKVLDLLAEETEEGMSGTIAGGVEDYSFSVDFSMLENEYKGTLSIAGQEVGEASSKVDGENVTCTVHPLIEGLDAYQLTLDATEKGGNLYVAQGETAILGLSFQEEDGTETIEIPDLSTITEAYNIQNEEELNAYIETLSESKLMEKLTESGLMTLEETSAETE